MTGRDVKENNIIFTNIIGNKHFKNTTIYIFYNLKCLNCDSREA